MQKVAIPTPAPPIKPSTSGAIDSRQQEHEYGKAKPDGRNYDSRAHPAETFCFRRLEKLFNLWQDIFGNAFEIARVPDFPDFLRDRAANLLARRNRRGGYGIGPFQAHAHRPQISAAGTAVLAGLTFFGSASRAKHSRRIIRLGLLVSSEKDSRSFRSGTCPADFSGGQVRRLNGSSDLTSHRLQPA